MKLGHADPSASSTSRARWSRETSRQGVRCAGRSTLETAPGAHTVPWAHDS